MEKRLSRWGVGPKITAPSCACLLAAWAATRQWPGIFRLNWQPRAVEIAGAVLIAAGFVLWLSGAVTVMRAYNRDRLITSGVFSLVRHPVYAGGITLFLPGLALLLGSWLMLLAPLLAYAIFKRLIHVEDGYLERRFGQAYVDYRARVNELIPIPRFGRGKE
ncbi:MAG TPA: isoprenylcysteine carboxylmethyltransferase family protein [Bryobacteraceae bacterium]|nr:isoprenylcysteine carboxylmethyltransferase family protein [Bryobacteraceae bacterium]